MDKEQLRGMISVRDRLRLKRGRQRHLPVKTFKRRPLHTISPWKPPADAARLMVKDDIGRLPVMDDGQLVGITARLDAMVHIHGRGPLDSDLDPGGMRN